TLVLERNLLEGLNTNQDIDANLTLIMEDIFSAAEQSIPNTIVTIRPSEHPWIRCQIKKHIRQHRHFYRKFKRTSNIFFWEKYRAIRNKIVNEVRKSKNDYLDKLDRALSTENVDTKMFWKTAKQFLNSSTPTSEIPTLTMNNEYADGDLKKAGMLLNYFASQTIINDDNKDIPNTLPSGSPLHSIEISIQDVKDVLQNLNLKKKACSPDLVSPHLLRGASVLAEPLSILFNRSLVNGYFPPPWKDANVIPIHKKDDKSIPSNYRPISLLSLVGKAMERCIHKHLYNYAIENEILTPLQSGFIKGDSTTFQLIHTYHSFCEAVDSGKEVRTIFCDISKAFDRVWHRGLLHKLSSIGCSNSVVRWFLSYLSGRKQRVVINGQASEWATIRAGVPQGSILGPLLFLIYINDIVIDIGANIRLFADDTSLYFVVDSPQNAVNILNNDLSTISEWAKTWLVSFNTSKTVSMVISRKVNPVQHPPLTMNGSILSETSSHKHLGITLSNSCTWSEHIEYIAKKAWVRLIFSEP
ncbi:MAG: reverse transcriptase family protein, partial [Candidatus Thiodiazotropha taylori]|nr:reverse transcriptase family protein [Candidatus Thiodiazotropha taylori]MCW4284046.1 reverse transcriptase family protein [Candidatus Thiodiazotropha taylori]